MNMQEQQLAQIEITIEQAHEAIALADALKRLHKNKDFKLVITEGLFDKEASRVVILRSDPEMASEKEQKECNDIITTIGGVFGYFNKIYAIGNQCHMSLEADKETRGDILQEQLGEDNLE
jgi:hypothetical protein